MFRAFIGYVVGILSTIFTISGYVSGNFILAIVLDVIVFVGLLIFAHRHHIKKRDEYYDKLHSSAKMLGA